MKIHEILQEQQLDVGTKEKVLAGILSLGLSFANQVGATEVYVYTDNEENRQVVQNYEDVPKGKIVYVVDVEDMDVKKIRKQFQNEKIKKRMSPKIKGMYRADI